MSNLTQGRVVHGGTEIFRREAGRIEEAVGPGRLPILTWGARKLRDLPRRYYAYNTEPLHVPGKLSAQYRALLDGAERVFDYSTANAEFYPRCEFRPIRLGPVQPPAPAERCTEDVLFYGLVTERRRPVIEALGATVAEDLFGDALVAAIRGARIVLCVNAYDDRNGNPFRAFPALECGGRLLVESTREPWFNEAVAPHAALAPYEDIVPRCRALLGESARCAA